MTGQALSLSGDWTGVFDYENAPIDAVPFNATLTDIAGVIWGTCQEPNSFSPIKAAHLSASISGMRSGYEIRFRKEYDGQPPNAEHALEYIGHVAPNGQSIKGSWRALLPGQVFGGPFVMDRAPSGKAHARKSREAAIEITR